MEEAEWGPNKLIWIAFRRGGSHARNKAINKTHTLSLCAPNSFILMVNSLPIIAFYIVGYTMNASMFPRELCRALTGLLNMAGRGEVVACFINFQLFLLTAPPSLLLTTLSVQVRSSIGH